MTIFLASGNSFGIKLAIIVTVMLVIDIALLIFIIKYSKGNSGIKLNTGRSYDEEEYEQDEENDEEFEMLPITSIDGHVRKLDEDLHL